MLILDSIALKQIQRLKIFANQITIPLEAIPFLDALSVGDGTDELRTLLKNSTMILDTYTVTFTHEQRPYGLCRHLSILVERGIPERAAVNVLMEEFGIEWPHPHSMMWEDTYGANHTGVHAVHVVSPVEEVLKAERMKRRPGLLVS
jgi:hypothetical protein